MRFFFGVYFSPGCFSGSNRAKRGEVVIRLGLLQFLFLINNTARPEITQHQIWYAGKMSYYFFIHLENSWLSTRHALRTTISILLTVFKKLAGGVGGGGIFHALKEILWRSEGSLCCPSGRACRLSRKKEALFVVEDGGVVPHWRVSAASLAYYQWL